MLVFGRFISSKYLGPEPGLWTLITKICTNLGYVHLRWQIRDEWDSRDLRNSQKIRDWDRYRESKSNNLGSVTETETRNSKFRDPGRGPGLRFVGRGFQDSTIRDTLWMDRLILCSSSDLFLKNGLKRSFKCVNGKILTCIPAVIGLSGRWNDLMNPGGLNGGSLFHLNNYLCLDKVTYPPNLEVENLYIFTSRTRVIFCVGASRILRPFEFSRSVGAIK